MKTPKRTLTKPVPKRTVAETWSYAPVVYNGTYEAETFQKWGENTKIFNHPVGPFNQLP